jgi:hypothetical protein
MQGCRPGVEALFVAPSSFGHFAFSGLKIEMESPRWPEIQKIRVGVNRDKYADGSWTEFDRRTHNLPAVKRFMKPQQAQIAIVDSEPDVLLREVIERLPK